MVIGDLTDEEAFTYLHSKLGIEEKVANQLIQLLGCWILDLKTYGARINGGETFEGNSKRGFIIWTMMMIFCILLCEHSNHT